MELTNYQEKIDALATPEFAKSGYRVELEKYNSGIKVTLFYQGDSVGTVNVSFTKADTSTYYSTQRIPKSFNQILSDVRDEAVKLYEKHNDNFDNGDLLKALEDRLNGAPAEMLVLTPGVAPAEDSVKPTSVITADRIDSKSVMSTPEKVQSVEYDSVLDAMVIRTVSIERISRQVWEHERMGR